MLAPVGFPEISGLLVSSPNWDQGAQNWGPSSQNWQFFYKIAQCFVYKCEEKSRMILESSDKNSSFGGSYPFLIPHCMQRDKKVTWHLRAYFSTIHSFQTWIKSV